MRMTKDHKQLAIELGVEPIHFRALCDAFRSFLDYISLNPRENEIVREILCGGKTLTAVGEKFNISRERTMQIFEKALRRAKSDMSVYMNNIDKLHSIDKLHRDLEQANQSILMLSAENLKLRQSLKAEYKSDIQPSGFTKEQEHVLYAPIKHLETISIRLRNCLISANIETLSEVLTIRTADLLKYHGFGRKSLTELREYIEEIGLEWH